jgi:hypothetical protein
VTFPSTITEFGSHPDIEDLGSPGGHEAGPAFFLVFGKRRYVFVWDYLVLYRLNNVFIWGQSIMGTSFSKNFTKNSKSLLTTAKLNKCCKLRSCS